MTNTHGHQSDPKQRARLRWRSRRGLLENDLLMERFLDKHEMDLTDQDVAALTELLELIDNELMDVLLGRRGLQEHLDRPEVQRVVRLIQES
ncbi:MAG: succinate dehydrogenase assembly factor 2 [Limnobacter sp.]|nr:succinate dehydrogenase assembly factor 2 [Limnobacter sp.]